MNIIKYPTKEQLQESLRRPVQNIEDLEKTVNQIFGEILQNGDDALYKYTWYFDKVKIDSLKVDSTEIENSGKLLKTELKEAIQIAYNNIYTFHSNQCYIPEKIETSKGVECWRERRAIEKVGLYIPGGTAPLFSSVLMLGIPAKIAGCKEVVLCTPPDKNGDINPAILYAAKISGIKEIFKVGGIQAIGAMAFGTDSIPSVNKIFGPGNQFVTAAKQVVNKLGVAIDMPAGPSEVLVIADQTAKAEFVAADLLSQAEHGKDSQVIFITWDEQLIEKVRIEIESQLCLLERKDIANISLSNSRLILVDGINDAINISNNYGPEHLILAIEEESVTDRITNAGSVFVGNYTPESAGDYASGTNHTLPTNGASKAWSGVSTDSFTKTITFQKISKEGLKGIGKVIEIMAEAEQLTAHKNAVSLRLKEVCVNV